MVALVGNKNIRTSEAAPVKSGRSPARATRGGLFTRRPEKVFCTTANGDGRRELAEKVRKIVCEEWERAGGSFEGAVVYQLLSLEKVEVPNYQMSAILNAFRVRGLITVLLRLQREEEVRKHGDLLINDVSPDLYDS